MSDRLREIRLYGHLGKRFGKVHRFAIHSPAEALAALRANYPAFGAALTELEGMDYRIFVDFDEIGEQHLGNPTGREIIRIVPVVSGSGTVVAEVVWYVASMYATNAAFAFAVNMIAFSAVSSLLAPSPPVIGTNDRPENQPSYVFDGAVNTAAQGNPVPVGYGRVMVGSQVLYAGLAVEQIG